MGTKPFTVTVTREMDPQWASWSDKVRHGWATMLEGIAKAA